jgi:peptide/nickel transport system substrate-binding protein
MPHFLHTSRFQRVLFASLMAFVVLLPVASRTVQASRPAAGAVYLTAVQNEHSTFTRNFNPFATAARLDFTQGGIYEPLMIYTTAGGGHVYRWLATGYKWSHGNKVLTLNLRQGVKWSDGKPFTAADVAFTFNYGKKYAAADETGLMQSGQVTKVQAVGTSQVVFHFSTVNTTVLPTLLSTNVMIVPQHIWSKISNPATYTNANPVGTGPFAWVQSFSTQEYILGKNPNYWQQGKPAYAGIRVPALSSNDAALASMIAGNLDWVGLFVPNAANAYVRHDPQHFHYFYANNTVPLGLYFNDEQYPYSLPVFRQAVSMALDRQSIYRIAEYGYEPPSDAVGIAQLFPKWIDPKVEKTAKALATYNPTKAKQVLTAAGFTYKGDQLLDPKGNPVSVNFSCPAGWDDWVTSFQIMQKNLQAIGIDATFDQKDATAWLDQRSKRLLNVAYWIPSPGLNPYPYFYSYMAKATYVPVGQNAFASGWGNVEGWVSPVATTLLNQYRTTTSTAKQHQIVNQLQKIQVDNMPFVPTVYQALWYDYSTKHFTGFPDKKHYYAIGSSYQYPDDAKILTTIQPVK